MSLEPSFERWIAELEERHLSDLTFQEVARALRALSSAYVERRSRLGRGIALDAAGKRAAFALFYGPLHYLLVQAIARELPRTTAGPRVVLDLGCGTGAAGAAWASTSARPPRIVGIDRHPWAVEEAVRTYRAFGLSARTTRGDVARLRWPEAPVSVLAAFTLNELPDEIRESALSRAVERTGREGGQLLLVEPIARFVAPWWDRWKAKIEGLGGRGDEWRVRVDLPEIVKNLDRAAGLDHRELTGRSLWLST